jgi:hypothetical protein
MGVFISSLLTTYGNVFTAALSNQRFDFTAGFQDHDNLLK